MMKVGAISDLHGTLPEIDGEYDLFIVAGDLCGDWYLPMGQVIARQQNWLQDQFNPWLNAIKAKQKIVIPGNHDYACEYYGTANYPININLEVLGLKVFCTPFTRPVVGLGKRWSYMSGEEGIFDIFTAFCPLDVNLIISHTPPYGILDQDTQMGAEHFGSKGFLKFLNENHLPNLSHVIHGHIHHPKHTRMNINGINFINCAQSLQTFEIGV